MTGLKSRYKVQQRVSSFAEIPTLDGVDNLIFRVSVYGMAFDCYFKRTPGANRLIVMFHGAMSRQKHVPPIFARTSMGPLLNAHILCISDPTLILSKNVFIGWYLGSKNRNPVASIVAIAKTVAKRAKVLFSNTVFYGSSAGGFAAMAAASHAGGRAIAVIPQIDPVAYGLGVAEVAKLFVPNGTPADAREQFPARWLSVAQIKNAQSMGKTPKIIYAQNVQDKVHLEKQFKPFCDAFGIDMGGQTADGMIRTVLYDEPGGHTKESDDMAVKLVDMMFAD